LFWNPSDHIQEAFSIVIIKLIAYYVLLAIKGILSMSAATENEIMAQIASGCESLGLELLEDGIYYQETRLVEFVHSNGQSYYVQTLEEQPQILCESVDLLDLPIGQLTPEQRKIIFGAGKELAV
jgi:hypothetical protein